MRNQSLPVHSHMLGWWRSLSEIQIPSMKLSPNILRETLIIIRNNEGDRDKMDNEIHALHKKNSRRPVPPSKKNATRAVTYPSLRHLDLIYESGNMMKLTASGSNLVLAALKSEQDFLHTIARHLVHWDDARGQGPHFIKMIRSMIKGNDIITINRLTERYSQINQKESNLIGKITRLISYYEFAGLVDRNEGLFRLNEGQIAAASMAIQNPPTDSEFSDTVLREYRKIVGERKSDIIPIPVLESSVCASFNGQLWSDDFQKRMLAMPTETNKYIMHFVQPMIKESKGLRIGDRYFYYVQILWRGQDET